MRIGIGYDIHRLVKGRKLILGGVEIPHPKGLLGHSDADSLIHAICDALLGAASCPDIGECFPNTDSRYRNISSLKLLKQVLAIIEKKGYSVGNIDTVVIADKPKIARYKAKMKKNIARTLHLTPDRINIKATTAEKTNKVEAIAASAVVLLNDAR